MNIIARGDKSPQKVTSLIRQTSQPPQPLKADIPCQIKWWTTPNVLGKVLSTSRLMKFIFLSQCGGTPICLVPPKIFSSLGPGKSIFMDTFWIKILLRCLVLVLSTYCYGMKPAAASCTLRKRALGDFDDEDTHRSYRLLHMVSFSSSCIQLNTNM